MREILGQVEVAGKIELAGLRFVQVPEDIRAERIQAHGAHLLHAVPPVLAGHAWIMHFAGADHERFAVQQELLFLEAKGVVGSGLGEHAGPEHRRCERAGEEASSTGHDPHDIPRHLARQRATAFRECGKSKSTCPPSPPAIRESPPPPVRLHFRRRTTRNPENPSINRAAIMPVPRSLRSVPEGKHRARTAPRPAPGTFPAGTIPVRTIAAGTIRGPVCATMLRSQSLVCGATANGSVFPFRSFPLVPRLQSKFDILSTTTKEEEPSFMRGIYVAVIAVCLSAPAHAQNSTDDLLPLIRNNDLTALKSRLANGADLNILLIHAAAIGSPEAVKLLLDAGADAKAKNQVDETALISGRRRPSQSPHADREGRRRQCHQQTRPHAADDRRRLRWLLRLRQTPAR